MQRKRDGLVPIGDAVSGLDDVLVSASEADPDLGFMTRLMSLCSLPRINPGNHHQSPLQFSASVVVA